MFFHHYTYTYTYSTSNSSFSLSLHKFETPYCSCDEFNHSLFNQPAQKISDHPPFSTNQSHLPLLQSHSSSTISTTLYIPLALLLFQGHFLHNFMLILLVFFANPLRQDNIPIGTMLYASRFLFGTCFGWKFMHALCKACVG
jgi:hypothetical protein